MGFKDIAKSVGMFIKDAYLERKAYEEEQYRRYSSIYCGTVWERKIDTDDFDSEPYWEIREEEDEDSLDRGLSTDALRREYQLHRSSILSSPGRAKAFREALQKRGMTMDDLDG